METLKKGLDGYTLKILALIFMTFDHISSFLIGAVDIPVWFNWIGRISAPIFIFMVAEGFYHTSNRKKYILRLYLWSVGMAIGNNILNSLAPHPEGIIIINNIFATMFLITIYLMGIEYLKQGIREKQGKFVGLGLGIMIIPIILTTIIMMMLSIGAVGILKICLVFVPTPMLVEGGILLIGLGIGFYLCRKNKKALAIFYTLFCMAEFYLMASAGLDYTNLFLLNYQWMMIFALPFLLLYNGEKGKSMKHLFYIYYPVHCYILYLLGVYLTQIKA